MKREPFSPKITKLEFRWVFMLYIVCKCRNQICMYMMNNNNKQVNKQLKDTILRSFTNLVLHPQYLTQNSVNIYMCLKDNYKTKRNYNGG